MLTVNNHVFMVHIIVISVLIITVNYCNVFCYLVHLTRNSMYIGYWTLNNDDYYYIYVYAKKMYS